MNKQVRRRSNRASDPKGRRTLRATLGANPSSTSIAASDQGRASDRAKQRHRTMHWHYSCIVNSSDWRNSAGVGLISQRPMMNKEVLEKRKEHKTSRTLVIGPYTTGVPQRSANGHFWHVTVVRHWTENNNPMASDRPTVARKACMAPMASSHVWGYK